jgi:hypothetical protein
MQGDVSAPCREQAVRSARFEQQRADQADALSRMQRLHKPAYRPFFDRRIVVEQ